MLNVQILFEHYKHGVTWGVRTPCWVLEPRYLMGCLNVMHNRRDFSWPNQFYFILSSFNFHFILFYS